MKIQFTVVVMVCCGFGMLHAQTFQGGIMGGFVASQVDGDTYAGYDKAGMQGGVFVNTAFTDIIGAQLEIHYTGKGARKPVSSEDPEIYKLALHYIDVPVLAQFRIKQVAAVELGVVPAYLFALNGEDSGGKIPESFLHEYKKFVLSSLVGLEFNLGGKFMVNFRYCYSLMSIRDGDPVEGYYNWFGKMLGLSNGDYNNYLTAGLYYRIR